MRIISCFIWLTIVVAACGQHKSSQLPIMLPHYAPAAAKDFDLPVSLREISGITFLSGHDRAVYAEQDEVGDIYAIDAKSRSVSTAITTNISGDFEDIAAVGNVFYLLQSDGSLLRMPDLQNSKQNPAKWHEKLLPKAEYEGLAYSSQEHSFYVVSKEIPKNAHDVYVYKMAVDSMGNIASTAPERIILKNKIVAEKCGLKSLHLKPSAIAYNTIDNQWYILSSVNHLIMVYDNDWQLEAVCHLSAKQYPQPEGMAFDAKGNLWLSSEAGNSKYGKIYKIERQ